MCTRTAAPEHKTAETHTGLVVCVVLLEFFVAIFLMQLLNRPTIYSCLTFAFQCLNNILKNRVIFVTSK